MRQMDIVPEGSTLFCDHLMEAYPTSRVYLLLALGTLGTNFARYSAFRRLEGHVKNVMRTGYLSKFDSQAYLCINIQISFLENVVLQISNSAKKEF